MPRTAFSFDLGPISRTLGDPPDHIGFASLSVHEIVTALLGARTRDEFFDWLWHDTFKALFIWQTGKRGLSWHHLPNSVPDSEFQRLASAVGVSPDRVLSHHSRQRKLLSESQTISNEFEQLYLGEKARFVQLTFKCQPTASTLVLRLAIAEAFLQAISGVVAGAIAGLRLPFTQVQYVFQPEPDQLTEAQIAGKYNMEVQDSTLRITHFVPSSRFKQTQVQIDLTDAPPDRNNPQAVGLSELLTVYRDDLTVIAALPLFITDPDNAVKEIERQMRVGTSDILTRLGIATAHKKATGPDLLGVVLDEQIEIRPVYDLQKPANKSVHALIARPYELIADSALASRCLVCGSPIKGGQGRYFKKSDKKVIEGIFSGNFTDLEHISFGNDVCPMCLIYANSDNKKLLRGSLAVLAPSTSLQAPVGHCLIEQPRFDQAGRFDPNRPMVKSTVTLQELVLLTLLSRRILAGLVTFEVDPDGDIKMHKPVQGKKGKTQGAVVGKYLPYSGAYFLFDIVAVNQFYRIVFLGQKQGGGDICDVWQEARLTAYPFEITLSPSFTMLLEMQRNADFQAHAQAHTLLKLQPTTVHLSPNLAFHVLVDNSVQEMVDKEYVDAVQCLESLASMPGINRYEFIKALLAGDDPITAAYEATEPPDKGRTQTVDWDTLRMIQAREMSARKEVMGTGSLEEMWAAFVEQSDRIRTMCQAHPTLVYFLHKPKKRGG